MRQILVAEADAKCEISSVVSKLENLQQQLRDQYDTNKKRFNPREWDRWSNDWVLRIKAVQKKRDLRNVLFPKAEEEITIAVNALLQAWYFCNVELRNPSAFTKMKENPKARIRPENLQRLLNNKAFGELADNIKENAAVKDFLK